MKTRNLIICIIGGWLFCAIVALIFVAVPIYLPPVFPKQKKEATKRTLKAFRFKFADILYSNRVNMVENANPTLKTILDSKKDIWGTPFWYKIKKWDLENSGLKIEICSSGPDKKPNTKDDIIQKIEY